MNHVKQILIMTASLFFAGNIFASSHGVFLVVKGDVKIVSATKTETQAKVGTKIQVGETAVTGVDSRAKIVMTDRNVINISPSTQMKIEEYSNEGKIKNVKLSLLEGKIRNNVEQKYDNKTSRFEVRTPVAVAGVRGTQFITAHSEKENKTEVITLKGVVEFKTINKENPALEKTVTVEKGEMSWTSEETKAPAPPEKVPDQMMKEMDKDTNVKNKESAAMQEQQRPPPPNGGMPPPQEKPPVMDGALNNQFDKTKVKVTPVSPSGP